MKNLKIFRAISLFFVILMFVGAVSFEFASATTPDAGIKVGDTVYDDVRVGDTLRYTVNLEAAEKFAGIQGEVVYDSSKLTFVDKGIDETLVNLKGKSSPMLNVTDTKDADQKKIVFAAAAPNYTDKNRYDFRTEKSLVTLEFKVKDASYSEIDFSVVDMDIDGDRWYFYNYEPVVTEGISITCNLEVTDRPETVPTDAPATQEPTTQEPTTEEPTEPEDDSPSKGIGVGGMVYYIADEGQSVLYTVKLKAEELFDVFDATVVYDSSKLEPAMLYIGGKPVTDESAQGRWLCPNLSNPSANSQVDGIIKISDIFPEGNDFSEGKILIEIEFVVKDIAYSEVKLTINEMTIKGSEECYFSDGNAQVWKGLELNQAISLGKKPLPGAPQPEVNTTESTTEETTLETEEPTQASSTDKTEEATEASSTDKQEESTAFTETSTDKPAEKPSEDSTQPTATDATEVTPTQPNEVTENITTEPNASDVVILGDANGDGKINIKDATIIQKSAASLVTLDDSQIIAADCDGNGKVNVRDATAIQKFAAGIETGLPFGEERTK